MSSKSQDKDKIWTPSNIISMLRLLMAVPMVLLLRDAYANMPYILALAAAAYASDLLDGYLARHFGGESSFGRIIDPLADKVLIGAMVLAMTFEHLVPLWFTVIVLARDLVIFLGGVYLKQRTGILVKSNTMGKAAVVGIGLVLIASLFESFARDPLLKLLMVLSLGLIAASLYVYGQRFFTMLKQARR